jgi:hypothetical protein
LILVDTSAWIAFFRNRRPLADRVDELLEDGQAALCGPIETELRRGLKTPAERRRVLSLLDGCHMLPAPDELWREAGDLGFALARRGATVKTLDLLIAAHALASAVAILTADSDFRAMARAGLPIQVITC